MITTYEFYKQYPKHYNMTQTEIITKIHRPKIIKMIKLGMINPKEHISLRKVYYMFSEQDIKILHEYKNKKVSNVRW